jgi:hypothetical protein
MLWSTVDSYFDQSIWEREVNQPQQDARRNMKALANKMVAEQFPLSDEDEDEEQQQDD